MMDRLEEMFMMQMVFMKRIRNIDPEFPQEWPVDVSQKKSQRALRDLTWKAQHELAEAVIELKNSKEHRANDTSEFNRYYFIEEFVDAWKYMQEVLILIGVTPDEFFDAYLAKDKIIHERLSSETK